MTRGFVHLRGMTALSVAITLFAAPIASAQTPDAAPSTASANNTVLLSPAAFARLVQPPLADVVPAPVVKTPPPLNLLRPAAAARQTQSAPAKAPQQKSWASRHKVALIVWSAVALSPFIIYGAMRYQ